MVEAVLGVLTSETEGGHVAWYMVHTSCETAFYPAGLAPQHTQPATG